ncbi:hypothetical protein G6038_21295 [Rhodococcus sp. 14C212]|uniref:hypothetical protein n=1 Tax=Rhodococcus sp. 14C212 TaxID=2711209 RepID=UPI0013EABC91|nr:hypothetical protein [Rhodococcus sp. 14C212]
MTSRRRRAAFDPAALGDLDDLLPSLNTVKPQSPPTQQPAPEPLRQTTEPSAAEADPEQRAQEFRHLQAVTEPFKDERTAEDDPSADKGRGAEPRKRSRPREGGAAPVSRTAPPEVSLSPSVYDALRALTLRERASNPTTARSYGQVVLDAIELHAVELETHWRATAGSSGGLFQRKQAAGARRRRHSEPQARVPLAGVIASDAKVLDRLAEEWGAGSRSALVEQALRLYLSL